MRICIVTHAMIGVSETFLRAHLEELPHEVIHLYGSPQEYSYNLGNLRKRHADHCSGGIANYLNLLPRFIEFRLRRRFFPTPTDMDLAARFLKEENVDVVLAEYGTTAAAIMPACRMIGVPLAAHFHGLDASKYDVINAFRAEYQQMFDYAAAIISVSTEMSKALVELGCPPEKISLNPCGASPRFFDVIPSYQSDWLLAVGRMTAKKAPYLTLDAFRRALAIDPSLKLRMVGCGELREVVERLVDAWNLQTNIEIIDEATPEQVAAHMSDAFAFLQHSVRAHNGDAEGTPVAILEAGAAGLPVVSTRHAGIPEVVIDNQTGYIIEAGDSQGMADRIIRLAGDRQLARMMGEAARKRIADHFTIERHITHLDNILKQAADKGRLAETQAP